jgi:hypothetical protein
MLCALSGTPAIIEGEAGAAKTSKQEAFFSVANGYSAFTLPVASMNGEDFGVPFGVDGVMHTLKPWFLVEAWVAYNKGLIPVILLDEFKQCEADLFRACLRLLGSNMLGAHAMPPPTIYIGTCNPATASNGGNDFTAPIANRIGHFACDVDIDVFINGLMNGFTAPDWPTLPDGWESYKRDASALVGAYARVRREEVQAQPKEASKQSGPWPSMRSWTNLRDAFAGLMSLGLVDDDGYEMAGAIVGPGSGSSFMAYISDLDLRGAEECLELGEKYTLPASGDKTYAELHGMVSYVVRDPSPEMFRSACSVLEAAADSGAGAEAAGCFPALITEVWEVKRAQKVAGFGIPRSTVAAFSGILSATGLLKTGR